MSHFGSVRIGDGPGLDAFGRNRVSQNHILLSSNFRFDLLPFLWEPVLSGGGTAVQQPNEGVVLLTVPAAVAEASLQTREYFLYRAGQSHLVVMTFAFGATAAGVTKRAGYFDAANGVFLQRAAGVTSVVLRSSTSGAPVDTAVAQAAWNLDRLDGTGPSGKTLDITKAQVFSVDLQYLGAGRVRVGLFMDGGEVYVHEFDNANVVTTTYMGTGTLPVRYEMTSDGTNGDTMRAICSAVCREGGEESPALRSVVSTLGVGAAGQSLDPTLKTILAVRLRPGYLRGKLSPVEIEVVNLGANHLYWELAIVTGFTGATLDPWTASPTSFESSTTVIAQSGEHPLASGFVPEGAVNSRTRVSTNLGDALNAALCNVAGTSPDLLVLRARTLAGGSFAHAKMGFSEYY